MTQQKTYIGISRDHSGSMQGLRHTALKDYNQQIASIKEEAIKHSQDTIVSTVMCGVRSTLAENGVVMDVVNSSIHALKPLETYRTEGMTPLFDSVGRLISQFEALPDAKDPNVAFLIMVITDGEENASREWTASNLKRKLETLQKTDRWSFTFRVPRGYSQNLKRLLGIPDGNIMEWDQNEESFQHSTTATQSAIGGYYGMRAKGVTSTRGFFAVDMSNVSATDVKAALIDISKDVKTHRITAAQHDMEISKLVSKVWKHPLIKGCAFYQLTKAEKNVQDYKQLVIKDKNSGKFYGGHAARQMLGFPQYGTIQVEPGDHGDFDIFIQSTSLNRKMKSGTTLLYWAKAL